MDIREAKPEDSEAIRDVHAISIRELGGKGYSQEQIDAWAAGCKSADYASAIDSDILHFLVATSDSKVVAFGSLKVVGPDDYKADADGEITGVYVHPSFARQGVGSMIYEELERRAQSHGIQVLGLEASLNAVAFYEAHGFQRVRKHSHEFSSSESTDVEGTVVEMKKRL